MKILATLPLLLSIWVLLNGLVGSQTPRVVNIGAIFTFDSVIGRAARPAMEAAVADVNSDPRILNGTELRLSMDDANCSVFLGSVGAFQVIEKEVVAVVGPQSSAIAHMISEIAKGLQVPVVSFAATDPTLSALQFPFFIRTTQSDSYQMAAMAELVDFYGWKEVIAVYVDDDYGRNGIGALNDELHKRMAKISYKLPLPVQSSDGDITDILNKSRVLGPRVYIVHVNPDPRLRIFNIAEGLKMMSDKFVWLVTDWLSATIDSFSPIDRTALSVLQGVVGLRQHIPETIQKRDFMSRWRTMQQNGSAFSELNTYGLQAYDTIWAVAYAVDSFINEFNITFSTNDKLINAKKSGPQLGELKVFSGGINLLNKIMETNFTGLAGQVAFNPDRNIMSGGYDVINVDRMSIKTVGYWSNHSGFSLLPPESWKGEQNRYSCIDQELLNVTWPGGKTDRPRGWEIADSERPLRIGVPRRASFVDFVTEVNQSHQIKGFCIDLFLEARKLVPYDVPYRFEPFGNGHSNPSYDELVKMVAADVLDAAVGDIAIVTNRTKIVDFSQPYLSSGLVIVAPIKTSKSSAWVFLKPFTVELWGVTTASFVMIAVVIWILEHRVNDDFRGPPKKQLITMFMFSFSTLFKKNQEDTVSPLARMVMIVWLFLLMVITASYTASLTSILTVQQLSSSPITGIDSLIANNWPIGYQVGSFAYGYLSESLYVHQSRLVPLGTPQEYEKALRQGPKNGGVAAIVDELPYAELFVTNQTEFGIIGQPFTRAGWGFAFQRESPLALDISTAILKLSESGELQRIHHRWFCKMGCFDEKRQKSAPNQLRLISFWGLYLLCGGFALTALLLFMIRMVRQFVHYKYHHMRTSSSSTPSRTHFSQVIHNFFDFIDEKEEAIKNMFTQHKDPQPQPNLED